MKRVLGVNEQSAYAPHQTLDFLELGEIGPRPAVTMDVVKGSMVCVLLYITPGQGGLSYILAFTRELATQLGLRVSYVSIGGQDHETSWTILHAMAPWLQRDQFAREMTFHPEYLLATAWPTAYTVYRYPSRKKLYFVQDYEPFFHAAGLEQYYAAKTYELGLDMYTIGPWLSEFVPQRHSRAQIHSLRYPISDHGEAGIPLRARRLISLYFQPEKLHRGTDLLVSAARKVSRQLRETKESLELVLFGSEENPYLQLDFPCRVLGVLSERELVDLFRETRIGVSVSFTNASQLLFRFAAHGCLAIDLNAPNVCRNVPSCLDPLVHFCDPNPDALAGAVTRCLNENPNDMVREKAVTTFCKEHAWPECVADIKRYMT